jgi:hypothetical protein
MSIVSEEYNQIERRAMDTIALGRHLTDTIAEKLDKEPLHIEQAMYQSCLSIGVSPLTGCLLVSEFLVALHDLEKEPESGAES